MVTIWISARWKFYSLIRAHSPLSCPGTQLKRCLLSWTPSTKTGVGIDQHGTIIVFLYVLTLSSGTCCSTCAARRRTTRRSSTEESSECLSTTTTCRVFSRCSSLLTRCLMMEQRTLYIYVYVALKRYVSMLKNGVYQFKVYAFSARLSLFSWKKKINRFAKGLASTQTMWSLCTVRWDW